MAQRFDSVVTSWTSFVCSSMVVVGRRVVVTWRTVGALVVDLLFDDALPQPEMESSAQPHATAAAKSGDRCMGHVVPAIGSRQTSGPVGRTVATADDLILRGAGEGSRTPVIWMEARSSTVELHPRDTRR